MKIGQLGKGSRLLTTEAPLTRPSSDDELGDKPPVTTERGSLQQASGSGGYELPFQTSFTTSANASELDGR